MSSREDGVRKWLDSAIIGPCMDVGRTLRRIGTYRIDWRPNRAGRDAHLREATWLKDGPMVRGVLYGLLVAWCLGWTVVAGLDLNFDLFNYHYYVAHAFWTDRLGKDFMAASLQSYLNPIAYLPFYWMVQAGWHSLIIALVLAALHSVNLILLLLIAEKALFHEAKARHLWAFAAAIAGGLSPVFLGEVGSTFNDVTSSIGVLLGLLLLFRRTEPSAHVLLAGLAMGIAAGLKLTNSIFVVAAVPSVLIVYDSWNARTKAILWFAAGAALGFALSEGYWAYRVYQEFGNPFFPYMNKLFAAPDFPNVNIVNDRFLPHSLQDALTLPLRMIAPKSWVYVEIIAPDLRVMLLIIVGAICLLLSIIRSWGKKAAFAAWRPERMGLALFCFFVISWLLWMASSGNGRYGLPVLLLAGPLLVWVIYRAFTTKVAVLVTSIILALQIFQLTNGVNPRWTPAPWKAEWLELTAPPSLTQQPYLYLSLGVQTFSFIIPFLHPDSAFINILGQWSIPSEGYGSAKLRAMLHKFDGRTRILTPYPSDEYVGGKPTKKLISVMNESLDRLQLRVSPESCDKFELRMFEPSSSHAVGEHSDDVSAQSARPTLMSCAVTRSKSRDSRLVQEERRLAPVFGALETACPELFSPPGAALDRVGKYWRKYYANTDISLWSDGALLVYKRTRAISNVIIGKISDFEAAGRKIDCRAIPRLSRDF